MGILSGYPFDPQSYQPQGILGLLAQSGMNLPMAPPASSGFPAPTDVSAVNRNGTSGVTLPQQDASGFGRDAGPSNPFASLFSGIGDGLSSLFSGGPSAAPAAAGPGAGQQQGAPPAPAAAGPGFGDRMTAALANFSGARGLLPALAGAVTGGVTGQRTDPAGMMQQQQQATFHALVGAGVPPGVAQAAALNPAVLKTIASQLYSKPAAEKLKDALGNERIVFANPDTRTVTEPGGGGGAGGPSSGPAILAPGVKTYDPTLPPDQYFAQFSPDMQAAIKAYMNGDVMPTGNPRQLGMANAAKGFAQLYGQKAGIPEKRKLRTDLAASGNSSMGGQ